MKPTPGMFLAEASRMRIMITRKGKAILHILSIVIR
jgi:hypothetical protein